MPKSRQIAQRLEVPADERRLHEVRDFVSGACGALGFTGRALANIRLAVDEACTNAVKHAYADEGGTLKVQIATRRGAVEIRVLDRGRPFDGKVEIPHLGQWIDARRKGGLGVFLMARLMDEVRYETTPAGNEWILRKRLPRPTSELARRLRRRWVGRAAAAVCCGSVSVAIPLALHEAQVRIRTEDAALVAQARGVGEAARPVLLARAELAPPQTHLIETVTRLLRAEPRLLAVTVVDRDRKIWASDRAAAIFTPFLEPTGLGTPDAAGVRRARERIDGEPVLHLAMPVRLAAGDADLGTVHLSLRWSEAERGIRSAWLRILIILVGFDAIAIALIVLFLARCLEPLQRLIDGIRALGSGATESTIDAADEIGAIAATLDDFQVRYRAAQESAAEHARLQEEMVLAREIQASILPSAVPEVPGYAIARLYRPAQEVGGDYYDFLDAGPGLTGVVVADVAGKGVPGSLVMSMVRTALRMETRRNAHAADVLARLHDFVSPDLRKGMFVTMLYVVLDARNRVASYASAGHTPMLLYRARTGETQMLAPRGLPVGVAGSDTRTFESHLDVERVRLQRGDVLLLYTDGITEARNAAGEEYGEARLATSLRRWGQEGADALVGHIEADLLEFTEGAAPQDDLTLVAIQENAVALPVAGEVQRKLFDFVDVQGMPLLDACKKLKVSPSTYYRLKREAEEAGGETIPEGTGDAAMDAVLQSAPPNALDPASEGDIETRPVRHDSHPSARGPQATPASPGQHGLGFAGVAVPPDDTPLETIAEGGLRGTILAPEADALCTVVRLEGTLDSGACTGFERLLAAASRSRPCVLLDLEGIAYVSSRAWGLVAATRAALRPRGELLLCGMRRETRDVFRMLGFESLVRAFDSREAAIAALQADPGVASGPSVAAPSAALVLRPVPAPVAASVVAIDADLEEDWESLRFRVGRAGDDGRVTLVALCGILDTVSALKLGRALESIVEKGARHLLIDVSGLEFVSSAGWGCFTAPLPGLRQSGGDLRLFGLGPQVGRIFQLLHLGVILRTYDVLSDAVASFGFERQTEDRNRAMPSAPESFQAAELEYAALPTSELERDAELRDLGWGEYIVLLQQLHTEERAA